MTVVETESRAPVADVLVRLGAYRGETNQSGVAEVQMPKGRYNLMIWKVGYDAPEQTMDVSADASIVVEVVKLPEENPDAHWTM